MEEDISKKATVAKREGEIRLSQKTCQITSTFILLSGEKLKCKSQLTFIFLSLFLS